MVSALKLIRLNKILKKKLSYCSFDSFFYLATYIGVSKKALYVDLNVKTLNDLLTSQVMYIILKILSMLFWSS